MGICPLLATCVKKVSFEHYQNFCINILENAYQKCDEYQKVTKEVKTPSEWSKLLSIVK